MPSSKKSRKPFRPSAPPAIDNSKALGLVLKMIALAGVSGREGPVIKFITRQLRNAGIPASCIQTDDVHRRSPFGGHAGNLICRLPGTKGRQARRLMMAHIDTVPLCEGSRPVLKNGRVCSGNANTALGADNRGGAAVLLTTALELCRQRLPHPPLTFFWPVQEEVGLHGARLVRLSNLGRPKLAFNWDGGRPNDVTVGATGDYQLDIEINGVPSHAGVHPERGVSAVVIAATAIAELQQQGWHGRIKKRGGTGTSNVGVISGGAATNVVMNQIRLQAEARSHDPQFRTSIVDAYKKAFQHAARLIESSDGRRGSVRIEPELAYESFRLPDDQPCVMHAEAAVESVGLLPQRRIVDGGLDANWLTARGLPTVTLGCGQSNPHTVAEELDIAQFLQACRIGLTLATAQ